MHIPTTPQVMIDLETLGHTPGSVIVALGAVQFDATGILDDFYVRIDPASCTRAGLHMDTATVIWWLKQPDTARKELTAPGASDLAIALSRFTAWLPTCCELWGNGASFDNALLAEAYRAAGLPQPWRYTSDRCYRTAAAMRPDLAFARTGTHHNALDDARSQAIHLIKCLTTPLPSPASASSSAS